MIYKAIAYLLLNNADLVALVGTRSYYMSAPEDVQLPWVVFGQVDGERLEHLGGVSDFAAGTFDVYSWSYSHTDAQEIAEAVRNALHHQAGTISDVSVRIIQAATGKEYVIAEDTAGDTTVVVHGYKQTFRVAYLEPDE